LEEQGTDAPSSADGSQSVGGNDGGGFSDDTVGNTSGSYSVDDQGKETDNFSLGISPSLSKAAVDSIGKGLSQEDQGFFGFGYNVQDFGRGNVSNISNAANYDPNYAMVDKASRGLGGQIPGLKGYDKTTFGMNISTNPLAQIDPKSALGQKYSQALSMAPNMMGPFSKASLQGLSLAQIDKMDPASLAGLMAASNMSRDNAYGTTSVPGYMGAIAEMLGMVKGPQDISYDMSLKDAIEKSRAGLAYGTVPGQDISNFGQIGAITDQISKDFSAAGKGIANKASSAFNEVTQAVADALGFATNPYGGYSDKDFSGMMSSRDAQGNVTDFSNMNDDEGGESESKNEIKQNLLTPITEKPPVVGESFIDPELLKYLKRRPAAPVSEVGYNQDLTASSSAKPVDFSAIDRGLGSLRSGIATINRNR